MIIDGIDVGLVSFGNTETINKNIILNTNPNGGVFIFRDSNWPTNDIRSYKIRVNKEIRDLLLSSILDNLGKEIVIQDQYQTNPDLPQFGESYTAILLRPDIVIATLSDRDFPEEDYSLRGCSDDHQIYEIELQFLVVENIGIVDGIGRWEFDSEDNSDQALQIWE